LVDQTHQKIVAVTTEIDAAFADWTVGFNEDMAAFGPHPFAIACRARGIVHTRSTSTCTKPPRSVLQTSKSDSGAARPVGQSDCVSQPAGLADDGISLCFEVILVIEEITKTASGGHISYTWKTPRRLSPTCRSIPQKIIAVGTEMPFGTDAIGTLDEDMAASVLTPSRSPAAPTGSSTTARSASYKAPENWLRGGRSPVAEAASRLLDAKTTNIAAE
jgi:hypothetical protein